MSHLGFGLPYAMALAAAAPRAAGVQHHRRRLFRLHPERTRHRAARRLPVLTIIHNNAAWGIIRAGQKAQLDFEFGTSLEGTDYAAIARGFGCFGETVTARGRRRAGDGACARDRACRPCWIATRVSCRTPAGRSFGSMNRFGFEALTSPPG